MKPTTLETPTAAEQADESPRCLSGNLGWLLSQAHYALASEVTAALAPLGISGRSYHVLAAALTGERSQTELAQLVGLDKTTMVVTMDELEREGLAERRPSATDRRARVIVVTKAGERKVAQAQAVIEEIQAEVLATLPARQRDVFLRSLEDLVKNRFCEHIECAPLRRREPRVQGS